MSSKSRIVYNFFKDMVKELKAKADKGELIREDARALEAIISLDNVRRAIRNKISRNDICPCGSNKKYKKCCVDRDVFGV